jgi:hypothetical protein
MALDSVMLQEPIDTNWSGIAEAEVGNAITVIDNSTSTELYDVRCQSTICRIDAAHSDPTAEMEFTMQLGQLEAFRDAHAFIQRIENEDGTSDTVTYISRAGYKLPELAAN